MKEFFITLKSNPQKGLLFFLLIIITAMTCYGIVFQTLPCVHPDSRFHLLAFDYFEDHWWLPDLNSDELTYSPYGNSRVYSGEIVYWVYGKIISLVRKLPFLELVKQSSDFMDKPYGVCKSGVLYGTLNSILFICTLCLLFYQGVKKIIPAGIAFVLITIPQVTYIYAYSNSDAWALSFSIFLFVFFYLNRETWFNSLWKSAILGILTGIVLASKQTFWITNLFVYLFMVWCLLRIIKKHALKFKIIARSLGILILFAMLIVTPSKVIYPLSQGDFNTELEVMREFRARQDLKPSNPEVWGYRLASKGIPFKDVILNKHWGQSSIKSFYGVFGYFTVFPPNPAYSISLVFFLILCLLTGISLITNWKIVPDHLRFLMLLSPVIILLNVLLSMYNSWVSDFQPQGRYLFASLVPLAILMSGLWEYESRWFKRVRLASWIVLYLVNVYVLWFVVIINPELG